MNSVIGKPAARHAADHAVDLLLDQVEHVLIGHRDREEQLAAVEVVDDVHRLEDDAGAELPVAVREAIMSRLRDRRRRLGDLVGMGNSKWRRR